MASLRRVLPGLEAPLEGAPKSHTWAQSRAAASGHADGLGLPFPEVTLRNGQVLSSGGGVCVLQPRPHLESLPAARTAQCPSVARPTGFSQVGSSNLFTLRVGGRAPERGEQQEGSQAGAHVQVSCILWLSPRVPEPPPPRSEHAGKGLGGPSPSPRRRPTTAPTHDPQ